MFTKVQYRFTNALTHTKITNYTNRFFWI